MTVIAIDGPAGSGKTSVARAVAARMGLEYLDTGAMYRAVAFAVLRAGGDPADNVFSASMARAIDLRVTSEQVLVDGVDATVEIRGRSVNRAVSLVAANPDVRSEMVARQREWVRRRGGGVLEGRDIGTVVFPDAVVKVYLTADPAVRAFRRARQDGLEVEPDGPRWSGGAAEDAGVAAVAADLARRDMIDSTRRDAPLAVAPGATVIDTTDKTFAGTVEQIVEQILGLV